MKYCRRCDSQKPLDCFSAGKKWSDGKYPYCKPCRVSYARDWRQKHPAKAAEAKTRKMRARRERMKELGLKSADIARAQRYKVTIEQFAELMKLQKSGCAICGGPPNGHGAKKNFDIDHCHETKTVRGLLCSACNRGLGCYRDNPELLRAAAAYLENSRAIAAE